MRLEKLELQPWILDLVLANGRQLLEGPSADHGTSTFESKNNTIAPKHTESRLTQVVRFEGTRKPPFGRVVISDSFTSIIASLSESARRKYEKINDVRLPSLTEGAIWELSQYSLTFTSRPEVILEIHELKLKGEQCSAVRGNPLRTGDEESVQQLFFDMKSFPNKAKSGPDPATPSQMYSQEEPMSQDERDSDEDAIATQIMRRKIHSAGHGLAAVNQQQQLLEVLLRKQGKNDTPRDQRNSSSERQSLTPPRVSQITKMNPEGQSVGEVGENLVKSKSKRISRRQPSPRIDGRSKSSRHSSDQSQARFGSGQPSTEQSHSRTTTPRVEEPRLPKPVPRSAERPGLHSNSSFKGAADLKGQGPAAKPAVKDASSKDSNMAASETFIIGQKLLRNKFVAPPKTQLQFLQSSATYVDPTRKGYGQSINLPPHILQELKEYHLSKSVIDAPSFEGRTEGDATRENAAAEPENVMSEDEGREVSISQRLPSHSQEELEDRLYDHSVTQNASSEAGSEVPWSSSPVRLPPQPTRAALQRESSSPVEEDEDEITIQKPSSPFAEGSNILQSQEIVSQTSLMDEHAREVQSPKSVQLSAITRRSRQFSSIASQHMSSSQPSMDYELDIGLPLALDARSSSPMPEMSSPTRFQTQLKPLILPQPPTVQIARSPFRPAPEKSSRSVLHGTRHTGVSDSQNQTTNLGKRVLSSDPVIPATCMDSRMTIASVEAQKDADEHMKVSAEPPHSVPEYTILVPGTCQHGDSTASPQQKARPSRRGEGVGAPASSLLQNDRGAVTSPDDMLMGAQPAKVIAPSTVSTDTSSVSGHKRNSETSEVAAKQVRSNKFRFKAPNFSQYESGIDPAELAKANRRSFVSEETSRAKELARSDVAQVEAGDIATDAEDVGPGDAAPHASQAEKYAETARPDSTSSNVTPVARQRTVSVINHEEQPGNEATVVVFSPVPPSNESIFERFSKAYPEYSHGERGFIRGCCYIDWLRSQPKMKAPHPSHFDDVIRTYLGPYAAYMKEHRAQGLKYKSAMDYFDNDVVEPLFTKRIVTAQTLGQALTVNSALTRKYRETLRRCSLPGSAKVTPVQRKRPANGIEENILMHAEIPEDRPRLGTAQRGKRMNGSYETDAVDTYHRPGPFVDEPRNIPTMSLKGVPEANAEINSPRLSYPVRAEHATSQMPAVQAERTIIEQSRPTAIFDSNPKSSEHTQRRRSRMPWSAVKSTQGIAKSPTSMARLRTPVEKPSAGRTSVGSHSASWIKSTVVNSSPSKSRAAIPNVGNSLTPESRLRVPMEETPADITSPKRLSRSRMKPTTLSSPILGGRAQTPMKVEPGNDINDLYDASPPRIQAPESVKRTLLSGTVVEEDMASPEHYGRALETAKATRTPDVTATAIDSPEVPDISKETPRSISTAAAPSGIAPATLETAASYVPRKKKRKSGLRFIDETTLETAKQYVPRKKKRKSGLTFLNEPVEL